MNRAIKITYFSLFSLLVLFMATKELSAKNDEVDANAASQVDVQSQEAILTQPDDKSDRFLINEVAVVVDGPERRFYVTTFDLETPSFDGKIPTLDDIVDEELIYQDALKHKIPITEYAQKHIQNIKKQHKLSDEAFTKICADAGLDQASALEKFEKMGATNTMIQHKADSFVAEHEVKAFYEENPVYKQAKFQLQVGFVPFDPNKELEGQKEELEKILKVNPNAIQWNEPFWLKEFDIAVDKLYIIKMSPGQISAPQLTNGGFELFRLKDKKEGFLVPLEKRYGEIVHTLRMPKLQETVEKYKEVLRESTAIVDIRKPQDSSKASDN